MKLVIDATVLFCGLIGTGVTKEIIFSRYVCLCCPKALLDEFKEHKSRISALSGLSSAELDLLFRQLKRRIREVPLSKYEKFLEEARSLVSDKGDIEYLALSLALHRIPVWSNDLHFKEQSVVRVFTTKQLVKFLKSLGHPF